MFVISGILFEIGSNTFEWRAILFIVTVNMTVTFHHPQEEDNSLLHNTTMTTVRTHHVDLEKCIEPNDFDVLGRQGRLIISSFNKIRTNTKRQICTIRFNYPGLELSLCYKNFSMPHIADYARIRTCKTSKFLQCVQAFDINNENMGISNRDLPTERLPWCKSIKDEWFVKLKIGNTGNQTNSMVVLDYSWQDSPEATVTYISNKTGKITLPAPVVNNTARCPHNVLYTAPLQLVEDQVLMITFPFYEVVDESIEASEIMTIHLKMFSEGAKPFKANNTLKNVFFFHRTNSSLNPRVDNGSSVVKGLEFKSRCLGSQESFPLFFSFHNEDDVPRQENGELFDCSKPNYEDFKHHFRCNKRMECVSGEDEMCPYNSPECGSDVTFSCNAKIECKNAEDEIDCNHTSPGCKGDISVGERCMSFESVRHPQKISWVEAYRRCSQKGVHLTTFHHIDEVETVVELLKDKVDELLIGLRLADRSQRTLYKYTLQWSNGQIAHGWGKMEDVVQYPACGLLILESKQLKVNNTICFSKSWSHFMCEYPDPDKADPRQQPIMLTTDRFENDAVSVVTCPKNHTALDFLQCDLDTKCFKGVAWDDADICSTIPMFQCDDNVYTVPYTLVCDYRKDCPDNSDEHFCDYEKCLETTCSNGQCLDWKHLCNNKIDCLDESDEQLCQGEDIVRDYSPFWIQAPSVTNLNTLMRFYVNILPKNAPCPSDMFGVSRFFRCPRYGYRCLPTFLRCNGVADCAYGLDELNCEDYVCPGHYHCRGTTICVSKYDMCDGRFNCPQHDDERFCDLDCPSQCTCRGHEVTCTKSFKAENYVRLRYVDASGSGMSLENFRANMYLVYLKLSNCNLQQLVNLTLANLRQLDVSHNLLKTLNTEFFLGLPKLRTLSVAWNPVTIINVDSLRLHHTLENLDFSGLLIQELSFEEFGQFPKAKALNLSRGVYKNVESFSKFPYLETIDISGSPVEVFPKDVYSGLSRLQVVHTSNFKLCCPQLLPSHVSSKNCFAPSDEISSCDNLLRSDVFRVFLWIFSVVAVFGNASSFVVRTLVQRQSPETGFPVLVTHLSLADFLMGIYLTIIGVADQVFSGSYLWSERDWKSSHICKVAGFLSLLSSEVSAFIICLITLDRFIVLRFPFSQVRFKRRSALVACTLAWFIGIILAAVPLTPMTSHWLFYSQSGICIPLPITRKQFPGQKYAFSIMIVLNFAIFVLIAVGQAAIFYTVRATSMSLDKDKSKSTDMTLARRLASVVISDFLCWFPIGVLGLLASQDVPIPGEVNVIVAIFVLPLNSALNPFLYTLNTVMEKKRAMEYKRMVKAIEAKIRAELALDKTDASSRSSRILLSETSGEINP